MGYDIIGDIHGQIEQLKAAHERIFRDGGKDALIAHVGDLLDLVARMV